MDRLRSWSGLLILLALVACSPGAVTENEASPATVTPQAQDTAIAADQAATATPGQEAEITPQQTVVPSCRPVPALSSEPGRAGWWNDTVFYELFVRSFYDSDGDGVGDINGVIQKLDYLNDGDPATSDDLGVTGIWLMPITESPSYHGYDVVDYFTVDQEYGTREDFQRLMSEAHSRGIQVIVDLVLNHTSTHHPWFEEAIADAGSPYRDYYIWEASAPGFKSPWGSDVWHRSQGGYYYGIFWSGMPDLNYQNPAVTDEAFEIVRFWLEEMGVDGLRLDAIKHFIEDGDIQENTPATHAWFESFYTFYKGINPEALTVGEAWAGSDEVVAYIGDEVDIAFEFDTAGAILDAARRESYRLVEQAYKINKRTYPANQYATFITNHDQDRIMSFLLGDVNRAHTAASLLLTGPGVPFLYYGEEVGQRGRKPDENIRTPMHWSDETFAGFTTADRPWRMPQPEYPEVNVAVQNGDPDSLLSHYRRLIHARNAYEALRVGDWHPLPSGDDRVYAFLRRTADQTLLVLINVGDEEETTYALCMPEGALDRAQPVEVLTGAQVAPLTINEQGGFDAYTPLPLDPYQTAIIELQ